MKASLTNNKTVIIRLLRKEDREPLYHYLHLLSPESRSRFGPHSFDWRTIHAIFDQPDDNIQRYIAMDETDNSIVAYMLIKLGLIREDQQRYASRNRFFNKDTTVTFAPSVADAWQSTGLGTAMTGIIEEDLKTKNIRHIILWGGVQATNIKAVNFYKKLGYHFIASFRHDEKDNLDMVKELVS